MSRLAQSLMVAAGRIRATILGVRIRTKILGILLFLSFLLGLSITLQVRGRIAETLRAHIRKESAHVGMVLAATASDLILTRDYYGLQRLIDDTKRNNSDMRYILILDLNDQLIASTFTEGSPRDLLKANRTIGDADISTVCLATTEGNIWDAAVPILDGTVGSVRVGVSEDRIATAVKSITGNLLLTTLLVALFGVGAAAVLTWLLTKPILDLVVAARKIDGGDYSCRVTCSSKDEVGELTDAFNSMARGLADAAHARDERDNLRVHMMTRIISAQEDERKRIARELHDETSQALTSLMLGLQVLDERCGLCSQAPTLFADLRGITELTRANVHKLALELRPAVLDDVGLVAALETHVSEFRKRTGLRVDFALSGMDHERFPSDVESGVYRIVQEGLNNVASHARARNVGVILERCDDVLCVVVEDDGCGFEPPSDDSVEHLGLLGIKERIALLGGSFRIESEPGSGTSLHLHIPLTLRDTPENI